MEVLLAGWMGAAALAAALGLAHRADARTRERLHQMAGSGPASMPDGLHSRSALVRLLPRPLVDAELVRRRLVLAGRDLALERHVASKARAGLAGLVAGALLGGATATGAALAVLLGFAGQRLPDIALAVAARRRQARIARAAGDLCDILAASVSAGLAPTAALELAATGLSGPLAEELRRALSWRGVGAGWREVLDELCTRTEAPALRGLRSAILQTERLGSPLETALRDLARTERARRRADAQARARAAPVKLLFPLALLILPAFLLLTVVPVVLATLRTLR